MSEFRPTDIFKTSLGEALLSRVQMDASSALREFKKVSEVADERKETIQRLTDQITRLEKLVRELQMSITPPRMVDVSAADSKPKSADGHKKLRPIRRKKRKSTQGDGKDQG